MLWVRRERRTNKPETNQQKIRWRTSHVPIAFQISITMFTCKICGMQQQTQKGLGSHRAQRKACQHQAAKFAVADSPQSSLGSDQHSFTDGSPRNRTESEQHPDYQDEPILDIPFEPPPPGPVDPINDDSLPENLPRTASNLKQQHTEIEDIDDPSNDPVDMPSFRLVLETGSFASYNSLSLIMYF